VAGNVRRRTFAPSPDGQHTATERPMETALPPRDPLPDATIALLRDPYGFISRRCAKHGTDAFATRLMGRPAICIRGEEAARLLYDEERFRRAGAAPRRLRKTLFGDDGVQGLDGAAHRPRKALFTRLAGPDDARRLIQLAERHWDERIGEWERREQVVLHDEVADILCAAVCEWAAVPLAPSDLPRRSRQMIAMIEGPTGIGPRYARGRLDRISAERWAGGLVRRARSGAIDAPGGSALHAIASHRDHDGEFLPEKVAAVELLNVIRPTVAVARFIVFCALALHEYPAASAGPSRGGPTAITAFAQEVRRRSPFFPLIAARTRREFTWKEHRFPADRLVILDLHGTNHDARIWQEPERFRPERFHEREPGDYELIPQGGGVAERGHRCPGEPFTLALMEAAVRMLTGSMDYAVPPQDLRLTRRAPSVPASGFIIADVRRRDPVLSPGGSPAVS
jgi:fatty-acid peroxygenase